MFLYVYMCVFVLVNMCEFVYDYDIFSLLLLLILNLYLVYMNVYINSHNIEQCMQLSSACALYSDICEDPKYLVLTKLCLYNKYIYCFVII